MNDMPPGEALAQQQHAARIADLTRQRNLSPAERAEEKQAAKMKQMIAEEVKAQFARVKITAQQGIIITGVFPNISIGKNPESPKTVTWRIVCNSNGTMTGTLII